jgi:hypothetical protein
MGKQGQFFRYYLNNLNLAAYHDLTKIDLAWYGYCQMETSSNTTWS